MRWWAGEGASHGLGSLVGSLGSLRRDDEKMSLNQSRHELQRELKLLGEAQLTDWLLRCARAGPSAGETTVFVHAFTRTCKSVCVRACRENPAGASFSGASLLRFCSAAALRCSRSECSLGPCN